MVDVFITRASLDFCSLPLRHQQFEKMMFTVSWPKMAPVPADEASQEYFLTIHFNLGNICALPLDSLSHLGLAIEKWVKT